MPKIIIEVMPKADLLDPAGKAVANALQDPPMNPTVRTIDDRAADQLSIVVRAGVIENLQR